MREHRLSGLHLATIEALALAIDAKDQTKGSHIRRVQSFSRALAHAVGVSDDEVQGIVTAALLHDVGKLAVPEHILSKPGPLTDEEFERIKIHPQVGFEIIEHVPFPYPVAPLVLCHHERWDGGGYPLGLRGEDIPLGARILAVSDYFDSVTRDRPYNKRMPGDLAALLLRQESGKALDPNLVSVFLELLPTLQFTDPALAAAADLDAQEVARSRYLVEHGERTAFENIAKAHQEIYALYDIAQAIGSSLGVADIDVARRGQADGAGAVLVLRAVRQRRDRHDPVPLRRRRGRRRDQEDRDGRGRGAGRVGDPQPAFGGRTAGRRPTSTRPVSRATREASARPWSARWSRATASWAPWRSTTPTQNFYTEEHRRLLDRISGQAASAIANSIVFEQTREASLSDALTGLPNTRYMFAHLTRELARAERQGTEVSILVLDLDDFKQINDTYGHHVGDRALREAARVLRDTIRPYDVCVRYAGDEFIIVLSGCGPEEAAAKCAELQQAVGSARFEAKPGQLARLSVSIGAAVFPGDGDTYEALLATADGRMYRDKKSRKSPGFQLRALMLRESVALEEAHDAHALALAARPGARVNY